MEKPVGRLCRRLCLGVALAPGLSTAACLASDAAPGDASSLQVVAPTFTVTEKGEKRSVTTLGRLKNNSGECLEDIVVQINYFDTEHRLVDTVTRPVYGLIVPPGQEVAFRVRDDAAARSSDAYVSQDVAVASAEPHINTKATSSGFKDVLLNLLINWGPMLLLIGAWLYFMRRMRKADSPQGQILALIEKQNALLVEKNQLMARLVAAAEAGRASEA